MQKEILTLAECRERLLAENKVTPQAVAIITLMWLILSAIISGILALIFWILLSHTVDDLHIAFHITGWCVCALPSVLFGIALFKMLAKAHRLHRKIQSTDIEIVEDTLLHAYQDCRTYGKGSKLYYVLDFQNHGKYKLPEEQHYTWSELYAMSDRGIYNTSISGDEFYILRWKDDRHHTPIQVFNKKLFEFCPDGATRKPRASWRDSVSLE